MGSKRSTSTTGTQPNGIRLSGPARRRRRTAALAIGVTLSLSACSSGNGDEDVAGTSLDASEASMQPESGVSGETTASPGGGDDSAAVSSAGTPVEVENDDRTSNEGGAESTNDEDVSTDTADDTVSEPAPPRPGAIGGSEEDDLLPPGFSDIDSVLREDSFDGPDLRLGSIELSSEETHRAVLVMEGTAGYPGWDVAYLESESGPMSSVLKISLVGVEGEAPQIPTSRALRLEPDDSSGDLSLLLHLDQEAEPFRVHLQHDPLRIVVEVTKSR